MRLLLRESMPLIFVNLAQLLIVLMTYWFSGARDLSIAAYSLFLSLCLLAGYFAFRYVTNRLFYQRLTTTLDSLDEATQPAGFSPLGEALHQLLASMYRLYQEQLQAYDRKKREHVTFITQWVHQMKTPLSVIYLTVQDEDDPRLQSIRDEADRMGKGLEMVLYAARLDVFEQDFHVERVVLRDVVHQVVQDHKRLFIRNYVYPEVKIDPSLTVESDAKWLLFIVNQLVTNAIRYSSGTQQNVTLSAFCREGTVVLEVRDRGVGIPKSDIKRVFQPFFTGENGRIFQESTGMGLYLVKELCQRMNHQIEVESEVGAGTAMRILFLH